MVDRPAEAPRGLWCEISGQRRYRLVVVAGIVGELDGDWLGRALWYGSVQLLDRPLGLDALVEPYEADALRQAYPRGAEKVGGTHKITLVIAKYKATFDFVGIASDLCRSLVYLFFSSLARDHRERKTAKIKSLIFKA